MNPVFKTVAYAGALALSAVVSAQANAAISLGTISKSVGYDTTTTNGAFSNLFNFTVGENNGSGLSSQSISFPNSGARVATLSLYTGTYANASQLTAANLVASAVSTATVLSGKGGNVSTLRLAAVDGGVLDILGEYTLVITGTSRGAGVYTTNISLAAVPEASTWAMMLVGFGAVGFTMRRRKNVTTTVRFA